MRKYLLLAAAMVAFVPLAYAAGYDLSTVDVEAETSETGMGLTSVHLFPLFDTTANDADVISADELPGIMGEKPFEVVAATNILTTAECGKTMTLAHATEFVSTLPAPTAGCYFKFIVGLAPSGADYTIVTASGADILIGGVNELEVDTTEDGPYDDNADVITFVGGVAAKGDFIEMISDGTSWFFKGQTNADGGVTTGTT